jgi:hypothetical protein
MFYLFMDSVTMLSESGALYRLVVGQLVNDELESMGKEAIVA